MLVTARTYAGSSLMKSLVFIIACFLLLSACSTGATATPAPTLTPLPMLGTPIPEARVFSIRDDQSIVNYEATLTLGGLKIGGTFGVRGNQVRLIPGPGGDRVSVDLQLDGNAVTGANGLIVEALKSNLETRKFPYGRFVAASVQPMPISETAVSVPLEGTLELHGQIRPVAMPVTLSVSGKTLKATAATALDLFDYGVNVPTAVMKSMIVFKADITAEEETVP
jgi:polyisoprenoid-binding protein YceI